MSCQSEPVEDVAVVLEDLTALNYETRLLRCSLGLGEYPGMPPTYSYPKDPPFFFIERIRCVKGTYCTLHFAIIKLEGMNIELLYNLTYMTRLTSQVSS
jgi:hypothetical protein